jgi:putative flippase GtrA
MSAIDQTSAAVAGGAYDIPATASGGASALFQRVRRLLRYTGVNLVTVTLDYAIFLSLTHFFGAPTIASIIGYSCALTINYELSRRYVFLAHLSHKSANRLMAEFLATGILGLVLTAGITGLSVHYLHLSPILSKTIAVLICFVALYVVRSRLVFKAQA